MTAEMAALLKRFPPPWRVGETNEGGTQVCDRNNGCILRVAPPIWDRGSTVPDHVVADFLVSAVNEYRVGPMGEFER